MSTRAALKHYAAAVDLWRRKFDTAEIAALLGLSEGVVAKWVANFRDMTTEIGGGEPAL